MLGGQGTPTTEERTFTQIEHALVRRLMDDALEDLRYSLGSLLVTPIAVDTIQYNSQFAQAAATSELMIVAGFSLRVGENTTTATLALPASVLLPQLGETNPTSTAENARELIDAQLAHVPVEVSLRLAPAHVRPERRARTGGRRPASAPASAAPPVRPRRRRTADRARRRSAQTAPGSPACRENRGLT